MRLLLVEGDDRIRECIAGVLRARFGESAVTLAGNLADAARLALGEFDLVLTEWRLPDATGAPVVETLRRRGAGAVIVVTEANVGAVAAEAVLCGAADYIVRHGDYLVTLPLVIEKNLAFDKLRKERDALHRQLRDQKETLEELLRSLAAAAATDHLTGLYNRRQFARELERVHSDADRGDCDLACVMLDMDGFKIVNDTFGHQTGDAALQLAAQVIRESLRRMDVAARYGGDEFVLLLPRTGAEEAHAVAERICHAYRQALLAGAIPSLVESVRASPPGRSLGLCFGVATVFEDRPIDADHLVAAADSALYEAKRNRAPDRGTVRVAV
jgi:two-component system, cell cycle response regulator